MIQLEAGGLEVCNIDAVRAEVAQVLRAPRGVQSDYGSDGLNELCNRAHER